MGMGFGCEGGYSDGGRREEWRLGVAGFGYWGGPAMKVKGGMVVDAHSTVMVGGYRRGDWGGSNEY